MDVQKFFKNGDVTTPRGHNQEVESSRAVSEIKASIAIAKSFPRDQSGALTRILAMCSRPTLAVKAFYEFIRGNTEIKGASIRLAEAIAQSWGNIHFGVKELEQRGGESVVEAFAWDVETNTRQTKTFTVKHVRSTKAGTYPLTDPRDIYEVVANNAARRLRACILGILPGDVVEAAEDECTKTLNKYVDSSPERLAAMVDRFEELGVSKPALEAFIQTPVASISPAKIVKLLSICNSLSDNICKPSDWFDLGLNPKEEYDKKKTGTKSETKKPSQGDSKASTTTVETKVDNKKQKEAKKTPAKSEPKSAGRDEERVSIVNKALAHVKKLDKDIVSKAKKAVYTFNEIETEDLEDFIGFALCGGEDEDALKYLITKMASIAVDWQEAKKGES
jgi:hypothetical protein